MSLTYRDEQNITEKLMEKSYLRLNKDLTLTGESPASYMGQVVGLSLSPPSFFQLLGYTSSPCSCLGPLTQEAQPVDQAEALCPDEGGGEILSDLGDNDPLLLVRHLSHKSPGIGCSKVRTQRTLRLATYRQEQIISRALNVNFKLPHFPIPQKGGGAGFLII